jgi:beta-phosphoglucomutase-like phosphatase (HAD superfamily)
MTPKPLLADDASLRINRLGHESAQVACDLRHLAGKHRDRSASRDLHADEVARERAQFELLEAVAELLSYVSADLQTAASCYASNRHRRAEFLTHEVALTLTKPIFSGSQSAAAS